MPTVSLLRADSYEIERLSLSVQALLEPLGGIEAFVKKGDRVLLSLGNAIIKNNSSSQLN
jgi:uncharacterized protein (DUF362 family)